MELNELLSPLLSFETFKFVFAKMLVEWLIMNINNMLHSSIENFHNKSYIRVIEPSTNSCFVFGPWMMLYEKLLFIFPQTQKYFRIRIIFIEYGLLLLRIKRSNRERGWSEIKGYERADIWFCCKKDSIVEHKVV